MNDTPYFTIIIPYYQGSTSDADFVRCLHSLNSQTQLSFEVLIYHDGYLNKPLSKEITEELRWLSKNAIGGYKFEITPERFNDWGHSLRDKGINETKGKYIIHVNADNLLYPDCLNYAFNYLQEHKEPDGITMALKMVGMRARRISETKIVIYNDKAGRDPTRWVTLKGILEHGSIDAMQLILKTKLWKNEGGWYDKREDGDGYMYRNFGKKYDIHITEERMGEHY